MPAYDMINKLTFLEVVDSEHTPLLLSERLFDVACRLGNNQAYDVDLLDANGRMNTKAPQAIDLLAFRKLM